MSDAAGEASAGGTAFVVVPDGVLIAAGFAEVERSAVGEGTTADGCVTEFERAASFEWAGAN